MAKLFYCVNNWQDLRQHYPNETEKIIELFQINAPWKIRHSMSVALTPDDLLGPVEVKNDKDALNTIAYWMQSAIVLRSFTLVITMEPKFKQDRRKKPISTQYFIFK